MPVVLGYWDIRGVSDPAPCRPGSLRSGVRAGRGRRVVAGAGSVIDPPRERDRPAAPSSEGPKLPQLPGRQTLRRPSMAGSPGRWGGCWLTPSACCWSTQARPTRTSSTAAGKLPYLIDGKTKLTQSNAILRYLARKHKLDGETEEEMLRVDTLENQAMDFRMSLAMICYNPEFEKLKPGYLEQLPGKLKLFSRFLGERKWFAGEKITFVDFLMYDVLDQNRMFEPKCLDPFQNLKDFLDRFEALEKIAAYMHSSRYMKTPVNNRMAKWSNQK